MSALATSIDGDILTPQGFVRGTLRVGEGGGIEQITGTRVDDAQSRDSARRWVLPGFIDTHVHGGAGVDVMDGSDAIAAIAAIHAHHGTTALLATTMTAPYIDLHRAFDGLAHSLARMRHADSGQQAAVLGVHLEGPYINPGKLGAQPDFARAMNFAELQSLHQAVPIRLITLAPEMPGNLEAIKPLLDMGIKVQIGHSAASYEEARAALERGATGFTHLFNAMTGLHHRKPGMAGAALAHAEFAEIIPDLLHVHPGAIHAALRCIPRLFCVTDSTAAAGMPDGEYRLGRQTVHKCMGGVRLADGTLAGSTLTMDQAFRNLVTSLNLSVREASLRASTYAAEYLGLPDRGRLSVGARADLVIFDRDLVLSEVVIHGHRRT